MAKQRVRELRGEFFSYGKASLTREVLRRFLETPEVKLLLPHELQERQRANIDAETQQLLLQTAKHFISSVYKIRGGGDFGRGRRTDVARNAMAAGLAQLLPRSLFESRRGRAACRILGISYRQAKLGVQRNSESLDLGGWRQIKTSQHLDNASSQVARALDQFWHSKEASEPNNLNKQMVRVDLGFDKKTCEKLYALHPRRAQLASARKLFPIFQRSAIAGHLRDATRIEPQTDCKGRLIRKGRTGIKVGWRQFCRGRCPCIKKRTPAECVCLKCSYLISNIARLHSTRRVWHRSEKDRAGGKSCVCHIHPHAGAAEGAASRAEACQSWEEAERAAMEEGCSAAAERWMAAVEERERAETEAKAATAKVERARKYDQMLSSVENLIDTLMPCGKTAYPELSIIGAAEFRAYKRRCIFNNCEKRMWCQQEACGFESIFGKPCPTEANDNDLVEWRRWEKRLRGVNDEGKEFYSLEWVPAHGTRAQLWEELLLAIKETLPHMWRHQVMQQAVRVYEDRKSGRHLHSLHKRLGLLTSTRILADALDIIVAWAEERNNLLVLGHRCLTWPPSTSQLLPLAALRALRRLANATEGVCPIMIAEEAKRAVTTAQEVFDSLSRAVTIQSDYASQLETNREFHATCATKERHNYLVSLVCYGSWQQVRARPRKGVPRRRQVKRHQEPHVERPMIQTTFSSTESCPEQINHVSQRHLDKHVQDNRQTVDYKQNVDGLFAFHKAGFKPNARSYNIVMEDVCHFLKYGTVIHGEWFIDGLRVPLAKGNHRQGLPPGLGERPRMAPDFPQMDRMEGRHDGCPNQFDYGTNYHQIAEWRTKSAGWALDDAKSKRAGALEAVQAATTKLEAATEAGRLKATKELEVATASNLKVMAETKAIIESDGLAGGVTRATTKLIEYHGKAGYDALGNVPKVAVNAGMASGALLNPGTRDMVLYLAKHCQHPSVAKADKSGWEAPSRYIWAFYDTSKFTKFAVPDATSFKGCQDHHRFIGLGQDLRVAQRDGPLRVVKGFCACSPCLVLNNYNCLLPHLFGNPVHTSTY